MGKISSITVVQNNKNKGKPKANPWFNKNDKNDNKGTEEQSMMNPLEQFDISNTRIGLDNSINSNNVTMDNNNTFINEIKSFINQNQKNSYAANAMKRKSMGPTTKASSNTPYPIGVGNYSNKNKIINFDKKEASKGALPVIMKKENQKIINNNNKQNPPPTNKNDNSINLLNKTNNNDISGVNMIDEALKNFGNMDNDESSYLDISSTKKWLK